jgi:hypothetical protein
MGGGKARCWSLIVGTFEIEVGTFGLNNKSGDGNDGK